MNKNKQFDIYKKIITPRQEIVTYKNALRYEYYVNGKQVSDEQYYYLDCSGMVVYISKEEYEDLLFNIELLK